MKFQLPKIYPITDTTVSGISHAAQVEKLIEGGATLVQLRDKTASARDFYNGAKRAIEIARAQGVSIIINDRVDIALALKADGVHLGQNDLPPQSARHLLGEEAIIGYSTHSIKQAVEAIKLPIDYIAIGPVFATATKPDHEPVVGLEGLEKVRASMGSFPLAAIGGITRENAKEVFVTGADSVAIIGDLLRDPENIPDAVREFLKI